MYLGDRPSRNQSLSENRCDVRILRYDQGAAQNFRTEIQSGRPGSRPDKERLCLAEGLIQFALGGILRILQGLFW